MSLDPTGLTKAQKEELKQALVAKKSSLDKEISDLERELHEEADAEKEYTADEVDRSSFEEEMQRQQSVLQSKQHLYDEVVQALERIDVGTYGVCVESEEPIGYDRLKAQPWVKYTLEVQKDFEAKKKRPHGSGDPGYPSGF